jgi:glycosyltransferase involved in cell wall biosynthesis
MDWFIAHVMPLLHAELPEMKLHIWGSQVPADVSWHDDERIVVEGYAESLDQVFNSCHAFIAPLQSGAGIKGKVLDSISYGVPTVLSPIAAEATGLVDGVSTLIADSPQKWVSQIVRLTNDESLWKRLSAESCAIRDTQYSFENGIEQMRKVFDALSLTTGIPGQQVEKR